MSKSKKFNKRDYGDWDLEEYNTGKPKKNKVLEHRVERALRTKNTDDLLRLLEEE